MDFPSYPAVPTVDGTEAVAAALGGSPIEILRARAWLAVFSSADELRRLRPDMAALARLGNTVCVTSPADAETPGTDFVCRYFAPSHGIPEDPVTGSAFCTLAPYWAPRLGKARLRARQLSRRGGEVICALGNGRVMISGQARLVLTGTFHC
jgi:predicted PhzF superfamily epimerase YddE/YHI9